MIEHDFTRGPEGWCSYDYHASMVDQGRNVFVLAVWSASNGVNGRGAIWSNHTRWSADTPERPVSILPLLCYRSWRNEAPVDLRDAELSVHLCGDQLKLDGAKCYFWIHGQNTRWHCVTQPLPIADGRWSAEPSRVILRPDAALWHKSWSLDPNRPAPLADLLGQVESYGFSFVGFSAEPTGLFGLSAFRLRTRS